MYGWTCVDDNMRCRLAGVDGQEGEWMGCRVLVGILSRLRRGVGREGVVVLSVGLTSRLVGGEGSNVCKQGGREGGLEGRKGGSPGGDGGGGHTP